MKILKLLSVGLFLTAALLLSSCGHVHDVVIDPGVAPTCTATGLTEGSHCASCGEGITKQEELPMANHNIDGTECTVCGLKASEGFEFISSGNGTCVFAGIGTRTEPDIVIPSESPSGDTVIAIGEGAFIGCSHITSVTIPDSVTIIYDSAFINCDNLTSITIPDSVTSIGCRAFLFNNLTSITIPDSVTEICLGAFDGSKYAMQTENGITYIDNWVTHCSDTKATSLAIRPGTVGIADSAFKYCNDLTTIIIPDSVKFIGSEAFIDCDSLTSITIPNSVRIIGESAFAQCSNLTNVTISDGVTSIEKGAFYGCSNLTSLNIPDSVTNIGHRAFTGCDKLIQKENGVSYVDKWVVGYDNKKSNVILRSDTVGISDNAFNFSYDKSHIISSITIPVGTKYIGDEAFSQAKSIDDITIPDSVISIGAGAFWRCESLTNLDIPDSVVNIGNAAFDMCQNLASISVAEGNPKYHSANNCLIESASKELILGCKNSIIPSDGSVTSIGNYAFAGCVGLKDITIPDCVTSIGESAFSGCSNLKRITIPDGVISLGSYAFYHCTSFTSITIPDSVTHIYCVAFGRCSNLTNITFENTEGWFVDDQSMDVTDPEKNVEYFLKTYWLESWIRK